MCLVRLSRRYAQLGVGAAAGSSPAVLVLTVSHGFHRRRELGIYCTRLQGKLKESE